MNPLVARTGGVVPSGLGLFGRAHLPRFAGERKAARLAPERVLLLSRPAAGEMPPEGAEGVGVKRTALRWLPPPALGRGVGLLALPLSASPV